MVEPQEPLNRIAVALLWLPDGRLAMQRRTADAPVAPGKLAFFGGHLEDGEDPITSLRRELAEEISLDVSDLDFDFLGEYTLSEVSNYGSDRHFYVFETRITTDDFDVYEGEGVESYLPKELLARDDVSEIVREVLERAR